MHFQRARQLVEPPGLFVAGQQRRQGLLVPGNVLQHILPVRDGPVEVAELVLQEVSDASDQAQLLFPRRGVAEVILEHLHQSRLVTHPLEDALHAHQGVPVAGQELENLRRGP